MRIQKLCSGAQAGADLGGLKAAKEFGIETGGFMPKGFKTEIGDRPEYAELYNIEEMDSSDYRDRTDKNIQSADATIIFATKESSPGTKLTIRLCEKYNKHYLVINPLNSEYTPKQVANAIRLNSIQTLNIAGNRESVSPGIGDFTQKFLTQMFYIMKNEI